MQVFSSFLKLRQYLVYDLTALERARVYGEHARVHGAELRVEIDAESDALDVADALRQRVQLFVEVAVVVALRQLDDAVAQRAERLAFYALAAAVEPLVKYRQA